MKNCIVSGALACAATAAIGAVASAHFARPEDAIRYRQAVYSLMGHHAERIAEVTKGARPYDAAEVQASAAVIETLSKLPIEAFGPGTDRGRTDARPEIWTNNEKFRSLAADMRKAVATLSTESRTGRLDRVRAAFGDATKACKACHDEFKKD